MILDAKMLTFQIKYFLDKAVLQSHRCVTIIALTIAGNFIRSEGCFDGVP